MSVIGIHIGKAIYHILKNDSSIVSMVGNVKNIQPSAIYTDSPKAGIYYDILTVNNTNTKGDHKATITEVSVQIECFKKSYEDVINLGARVQELLDKKNGTFNGVNLQSCVLESQSSDFDGNNKLYYLQLTFKTRIT